jgi:hypothetical protein
MATLFTDAQLADALRVSTVDATQAYRAHARAMDYLRLELGVELASANTTLTRRVPRGRAFQRLSTPLTSITSVTVNGSALTVTTDYEATDVGVSCPGGFGKYLTGDADWCTLVVVYVAGFSTVPSELTEAGLILGAMAYSGPAPGVKSSTVSVDGVQEAVSYDMTSDGFGLPEGMLKGLRARYGTGRRQFGSVLVR